MTEQTCQCGKPAHPLYGGRCEDCWVGAQGSGGYHYEAYRRGFDYAASEAPGPVQGVKRWNGLTATDMFQGDSQDR